MIETIEKFATGFGLPAQVAWIAIGFLLGVLVTRGRKAVDVSAHANLARGGDLSKSMQSAPENALNVSHSVKTVDLSNDTVADIMSLLRQGNKIEAVKVAREATGLGLKESKDMVEALEAQVKGR